MARRCSFLTSGHVEAKRNRLVRARRMAVEAIETFRRLPSFSNIWIRSALAICDAEAAVVARLVIALDLKQWVFACDSEQCAQRADVAAPKARPVQVEQNDGNEKE